MEHANVPLVARTWRPCLLCGLLLASKVWQDLRYVGGLTAFSCCRYLGPDSMCMDMDTHRRVYLFTIQTARTVQHQPALSFSHPLILPLSSVLTLPLVPLCAVVIAARGTVKSLRYIRSLRCKPSTNWNGRFARRSSGTCTSPAVRMQSITSR